MFYWVSSQDEKLSFPQKEMLKSVIFCLLVYQQTKADDFFLKIHIYFFIYLILSKMSNKFFGIGNIF